MPVHALFDGKRRDRIRRALRKGEPLPKAERPDSLAFARAAEMVDDIGAIIANRDKEARMKAQLAKYRVNQELIKAVQGRDQLAAEAALAKGADVNARRFPMGATIMLSAGETHEMYACKLTEEKGDTALMVAAQNNDLEMVKLLVERNADVNARTNYGMHPTPSALDYAEKLGFQDIARYLRSKGAES